MMFEFVSARGARHRRMGVLLTAASLTLLGASSALAQNHCSYAATSQSARWSAKGRFATSLTDVSLVGYQGWFRCPGDASNLGWVHWSGDAGKTFPVEMWPDMTEYGRRYRAASHTLPNGEPAYLYSPIDYETVLTHFKWMKHYGLDGAWLQRFVVGLPNGPVRETYASNEIIRKNVQAACKATGRVWALAYDIAGMPTDRVYDLLTKDWEDLVAKGVPNDPRYLFHDGKPVVLIWGYYSHDNNNHMTPELGNRLIDYFERQGVFLVGGGGWWWYRDTEPDWVAMYHRLHAFCGWNVGNWWVDKDGNRRADITNYTRSKDAAAAAGMLFLPVLYPGYSWSKCTPSNFNLLPRRKGDFYWEQWVAARQAGFKSVYLAMFDEVDEGTAIYKVANTPPVQGQYVTYEGMPSDWYMRLANAGLRMLHGKIPLTYTIPIKP